MGEPLPAWMQEYLKLIKEFETTDNKEMLDIIASKIRAIVKENNP